MIYSILNYLAWNFKKFIYLNGGNSVALSLL